MVMRSRGALAASVDDAVVDGDVAVLAGRWRVDAAPGSYPAGPLTSTNTPLDAERCEVDGDRLLVAGLQEAVRRDRL